jgi:hypothetical protein
LKNLKSKNCEGPDRLPLRILKDGATVLSRPLSVLFHKIYERKEIPEQWKVSKVIPLHKKGKKEDIENYRPISNLCSITKVFEKLILLRLEEIEKENGIDLTGYEQHGFKKKRSTITAGLTIHSIIAREMDTDCYVAMSSLDLTAAFDLVNLDLSALEENENNGTPRRSTPTSRNLVKATIVLRRGKWTNFYDLGE